ncbi:hypothetical protein IW261DRAFT_1680896 [Armillaria novae-zelandiae]|uniref:NADH:flavin oxidoreductase/NADH oxidase N-terminal domain-containing protein n=2 Tax=Armillaria novae-zelandiae TaxID=153914 RepID=A0AA39PBS8_9AGAR|nr:hypothetical protein IW261DRAFT_1680896 [Armillaria novae-zelandiae]
MALGSSELFRPIRVGALTLNHRIGLAPMARFKATETGHVPILPLVKEYYTQRASDPGTLLITEATIIAQKAGVNKNAPGVWSEEQLQAWKEVTDSVHNKGSYIYCQLWALGRMADYNTLWEEDPPLPYVAPSAVPLSGKDKVPRAMTLDEIHEYIQLYAQAAANAVNKAGFDGVEIHGVHGYLVDQFLQDVVNRRTDDYGGSIENRARFSLEVIDAVVKAIGAALQRLKTAIRLSPWEVRMNDPIPTFSYFVSQIKKEHPDLSYIHVVEPRIDGSETRNQEEYSSDLSNDFLRKIWAPKPYIAAGAFTRVTAMEAADEKGDIVAFGRHFISNPDLTVRLKKNLPLTPYNRSTFYLHGNVAEGYIDYPFAFTVSN